MFLPLAPTLHGPGGASCPEACSTTPHNSVNSGVLLTDNSRPIMPNSLLFNSIKMEENIYNVHKNSSPELLQRPQKLSCYELLCYESLWNLWGCFLSRNNQNLHHRTPFVQDLLVYWAVAYCRTQKNSENVFSCNRLLTAFVQYRITLFSAWFCFQPHYQAEKNTYHSQMSAEKNKSKAH